MHNVLNFSLPIIAISRVEFASHLLPWLAADLHLTHLPPALMLAIRS